MASKVKVVAKALKGAALGIIDAYIKINPQASLADLNKTFESSEIKGGKQLLFTEAELDKEVAESSSSSVAERLADRKKQGYFVTMPDGTKISFSARMMWNQDNFPILEAIANKLGIEVASFDSWPAGSKGFYIIENAPSSADSDAASKEKNNASASLNGVEYVDLGLPSGLKWAKMNLGATKPEEYGWYIAWGELRPKADYSKSSSLTHDKDDSKLKSEGIIDDKRNLTAAHDVASKVCGGKWRMPTKADFKELMTYCTWEWTTLNGVKGYKVKSTMPGNDNWIFLPAAGDRDGTSNNFVGFKAFYWSYNGTEYWGYSHLLYFDSNEKCMDEWGTRYIGHSIRPVSE